MALRGGSPRRAPARLALLLFLLACLPLSSVGCALLGGLLNPRALPGGQGAQPGLPPPPQASTPQQPTGPDPLAGGGIAIPPALAGPGTSDLTPPGGLAEGDYDPRRDLRTTQIRQYQYNPPRQEANVAYVRDVLSHDPRPDMQTTNMGTWVHETSHGIHAEIRNAAVRAGVRQKLAGVYLENGTGAFCYDPQVSKSRVPAFLPAAAQGVSRYRTYVTGQMRDWPNALSLFDEWGSYVNGGRACVEVFNAGLWREGTVDSVDGMTDFLYFATAAARVVQADAPTWFDPQGDSGRALKGLFGTQAERTAKWLNAGLQVPNFRAFHAGQLFRHFQSSPENADNRRFLVEWMGAAWTARVLGFSQ